MQYRQRITIACLLPFFIIACTAGGHDSTGLKPLSECLANQSTAYGKSASRALAQLSPALLIGERFAVFSHVYNSQPAGGYPIRFLADGSITGTQYDGYQWSIAEGDLRIMEPKHGGTWLFGFNQKCASLTHRSDGQENPLLQIEIAVVKPAPK